MAMRAARRSARRICAGVIVMVAVPSEAALAEEPSAWCSALCDVAAAPVLSMIGLTRADAAARRCCSLEGVATVLGATA
jgi:hypothetical protein